MGDFLVAGTVLGGVVGFFHAIQCVRSRVIIDHVPLQGALGHGLWVWALWTVFGSYVLFFWLIGLIAMTASGLVRTKGPAR